MEKSTKNNLTDSKTWIRLVYMILFAVAFNVAEVVLVAVVIIQFLFQLFTGRAIEQLRTLGGSLGAYASEIIAFLTFHSDDRPFPFGRWPEGPPANKPKGAKAAAKPARPSRSRKPKATEGTAEPAASE